jgi:hypothetical protein
MNNQLTEPTQSKVVDDFLGQPLSPGDYVLVPNSFSNGRSLTVAQILHFSPKMIRVKSAKGTHGREMSVYACDVVRITDEQLVWYRLKKG